MAQTRLQTAGVYFPGIEDNFLTLEKRPIADPEFAARITVGNVVSVKDPVSCSTYWWYHDGIIIRIEADGTETTWWPVPTMNDAINRLPNDGIGCRFYNNGSVVMQITNTRYYWGPLTSGEPIIGDYFAAPCVCDDCYDDESVCSRFYSRNYPSWAR